jgi:hypothetical protein
METPSDVVAERVKAARKGRFTVAQLAKRCAELGATGLTEQALYNIETGRPDKQGRRRRAVTVDELLALAYALSVAPVHLLIPIDDELQPFHHIPKTAVRAGRARAWVRGDDPLSTDRRVYFSQVPEHEWTPPPRTEGPLSAGERQAIVEDLERDGRDGSDGEER